MKLNPSAMPGFCAGKIEVESPTAQTRNVVLNHGDALMIVDVQKDFLTGGSLAVPEGEEVIAPLNRYVAMFVNRNLPVFVSGDWHPPDHCSFDAQGGPWPPHCVANTRGAAFAENLNLPDSAKIVRNGQASDREAYSAFDGTELEAELRRANVQRLFVGGLATDYCVRQTARDALEKGFQTFLLQDAVRAVNAHPEDGRNAEAELAGLGARPISLEDLTRAG